MNFCRMRFTNSLARDRFAICWRDKIVDDFDGAISWGAASPYAQIIVIYDVRLSSAAMYAYLPVAIFADGAWGMWLAFIHCGADLRGPAWLIMRDAPAPRQIILRIAEIFWRDFRITYNFALMPWAYHFINYYYSAFSCQ